MAVNEPEIVLKTGQIVVDTVSGDIGLLLSRFNIFDDEEYPIWAWDILWSGPATTEGNRRSPYTESGLFGLLKNRRFLLYESS